MVLSVHKPKHILDPSSGSGNLTKYFNNVEISEFEIRQGTNFFEQVKPMPDVDLVMCNPPFIAGDRKRNMPELFMRHILKLVPEDTPIVFIVPFNFRLNCRKKSVRLRYLNELNITSIITLPFNVFDDVFYHCEVLILNLPSLKTHYSYVPKILEEENKMSAGKLKINMSIFEGKSKEEVEEMQAAAAAYIANLEAEKEETLKAQILDLLSENNKTVNDLPTLFNFDVKKTSSSSGDKTEKPPKYLIDGYLWTGNGKGLPKEVQEAERNTGKKWDELKGLMEYRNPEHPTYKPKK